VLKEAVKLGRKKTDLATTLGRTGRFRVRAIARTLAISRSNLQRRLKVNNKNNGAQYPSFKEDEALLTEVMSIISRRGTYGYRRVTAIVNHQRNLVGESRVNHKRIYRIMKENKLLLTQPNRKPTRTHDGKVITLNSNMRWCSDGFVIQYWNGDKVHVAFSLDTCDREVMRYITSIRGIDGAMIRDLMLETVEYWFSQPDLPHKIQWLSDNGPCYTAHDTVKFGRLLGF
jgi:putative transposase